ncbi:hypothetical protein D3C76_1768690 [compost metagenome]
MVPPASPPLAEFSFFSPQPARGATVSTSAVAAAIHVFFMFDSLPSPINDGLYILNVSGARFIRLLLHFLGIVISGRRDRLP